jgi:hypothetical protein
MYFCIQLSVSGKHCSIIWKNDKGLSLVSTTPAFIRSLIACNNIANLQYEGTGTELFFARAT